MSRRDTGSTIWMARVDCPPTDRVDGTHRFTHRRYRNRVVDSIMTEPTTKYVTRAIRRPTHPDGKQYRFNCCFEADVWVTSDDRRVCRNCGHDWTDELIDDD